MPIRPATQADAAAIAAIWNHYIRDTIVTFNAQEKTATEIAAGIADPKSPFYLAEQDNRIEGFATYSDFRKGVGYAFTKEHTVMLAPGTGGKGLGRALMAEIERHATRNGINSLFAGVSAENTDGVAFHAACGYAEVARLSKVGWKFGRWHDLVLMQKFL
jgi:L-amino acid N-acyltransferase YncA